MERASRGDVIRHAECVVGAGHSEPRKSRDFLRLQYRQSLEGTDLLRVGLLTPMSELGGSGCVWFLLELNVTVTTTQWTFRYGPGSVGFARQLRTDTAHNFPFDPLRDIEGLTRKLPVDLIHLVALRCTVFVSSGFDLFSCLGFSGGCVEVIRWNVERSYHN